MQNASRPEEPLEIRIREHNHKTQSPTIQSMGMEKAQLKSVENEIATLENRIMLLRQQEQRQKHAINRNKLKTKDVIDKKLQVNEIQKLKERDSSKDAEIIEILKRKNKQARSEHEKEMNTILKACYLVKLDEARQIKNLSAAHEQKLKQIKGAIYEQKKAKQQRIKKMSNDAKDRYQNYWRNRLSELYSSHHKTAQQAAVEKEQKLDYLKKLQEEEIKMLEKINKIHEHSIQSKKQYITALNIPVKEVSELVNTDRRLNSSMDDSLTVKANTEVMTYREMKNSSMHHSPNQSQMKIPKVNLNEAKLRHILKQLKRTEQPSTSQVGV